MKKGLWEKRFDKIIESLKTNDKKTIIQTVFSVMDDARAFHYQWIASAVWNKLQEKGLV